MPYAPGRPCRNKHCSTITTNRNGYCDACQDLRWKSDKYRQKRAAVYDWQWKKLRRAYLAEHPLCEDCEEWGRVTPADMVHHKTPVEEGGGLLDWANLRSLCWACHGKYQALDLETCL